MFRDLVDEVDTKVGIIVSTTMCSTLCPCDLAFDADKAEEKQAWLDVLTDWEQLKQYDRCLLTDPTCELDRAIIYTDGTGQTIEEMTGYDTKSYSSFERCLNDLSEGKRDTAQVSDEEVQNYKDLAQD